MKGDPYPDGGKFVMVPVDKNHKLCDKKAEDRGGFRCQLIKGHKDPTHRHWKSTPLMRWKDPAPKKAKK